jgi:hypothetical protein
MVNGMDSAIHKNFPLSGRARVYPFLEQNPPPLSLPPGESTIETFGILAVRSL